MLISKAFHCCTSLSVLRIRSFSTLSTNTKKISKNRIQAWQIHAYGNLDELTLSNIRMPVISKPTQVIVKVEASSVNPIDVAMINGYGVKLMNLMRRIEKLNEEIEFPLTTGRDFSGIVVAKGHSVGSKFELGDEVWGVVPVEQQGCHATHVVVDSDLISPRPSNLSHIEASSILYAGLTAWSSLWVTGGLCCEKLMSRKIGKKVLILGGSGGVGTLAIQMAKAWKSQVISTCSTDAVDLLKKLGADIVIDYKQNDADDLIVKEGIYDIILDCSNQGVEKIESKNYLFKTYITLNPPLLRNFDDHGLIGGTMNNLLDLFKHNISKINNRSCVKWGFFVPSATGIRSLQKLVENQQLRPVIENVYQFDKLPEAYRRVAEGHLRGKVVIDMTS